jgi:hypothetical protein
MMTDDAVIKAIIECIASHAYTGGGRPGKNEIHPRTVGWHDYLERRFPGITEDQVARCFKEADRLYLKAWGDTTQHDFSDDGAARNDH